MKSPGRWLPYTEGWYHRKYSHDSLTLCYQTNVQLPQPTYRGYPAKRALSAMLMPCISMAGRTLFRQDTIDIFGWSCASNWILLSLMWSWCDQGPSICIQRQSGIHLQCIKDVRGEDWVAVGNINFSILLNISNMSPLHIHEINDAQGFLCSLFQISYSIISFTRPENMTMLPAWWLPSLSRVRWLNPLTAQNAWVRTQHCGCWCHSAKSPCGQYPQHWLNVYCTRPVSYRNNTAIGNNIRK